MRKKCLVLFSGGLDSVVLATKLKETYDLTLLNINYGQRNQKEISYAERFSEQNDLQYININMTDLGNLYTESCLTNHNLDIPQGTLTPEQRQPLVVPNRNGIMLSIAWGLAANWKMDAIAMGIYSTAGTARNQRSMSLDCTTDFIKAIKTYLEMSTRHNSIEILTPFMNHTKADIIREGDKLLVPLHFSWTCFDNKENHCGKCYACLERKKAFKEANVVDLTEYEE